MPYPWPSYGGFLFQREEQAIWETDAGWVPSPNYSRQKPLGSSSDVLTALSIGSKERTFECVLTPQRYASLESMLNTKASFTDWTRPVPDSREAFLAEVIPIADVVAKESFLDTPSTTNGSTSRTTSRRKVRTRVTLISA